jgi:hypothetical protein
MWSPPGLHAVCAGACLNGLRALDRSVAARLRCAAPGLRERMAGWCWACGLSRPPAGARKTAAGRGTGSGAGGVRAAAVGAGRAGTSSSPPEWARITSRPRRRPARAAAGPGLAPRYWRCRGPRGPRFTRNSARPLMPGYVVPGGWGEGPPRAACRARAHRSKGQFTLSNRRASRGHAGNHPRRVRSRRALGVVCGANGGVSHRARSRCSSISSRAW